jgi:hypothetical protein
MITLDYLHTANLFQYIKSFYMARVSNTLIGHASGRVGNAVFSTWKGINVLKEKPSSVANPDTDNQQMRRSALSQVVSIFRQAPAAIRAGFKKLAVSKSEWNAFASNALRFSFDFSSPPTALLVPDDLLVSKGTISETPISTVTADVSSTTIVVTYPATAADPGQSLTDNAIIVGYNSTLNDWTGNIATGIRSAGTASIPIPGSWVAGNSIVVYLAFYNPLSQESSDSVNTTGTVVA